MPELRFLPLFVCLASLAGAQAAKTTTAPPPGVIHAVVVQGNNNYKTPDIVQVLGLTVGQPATPEVFKAAQGRLLETDLFSDVSYEFRFSLTKPAQYTVTYKVTEFDQLFPIQFEELGIPDATVRAYLKAHVPLYNERIPPTQKVLDRYSGATQELVAQTNPKLKLKGTVSSDDPDHPMVLIRPDAPMPRIAAVTITGNKAIETAALQRALNDVAVGQRLSDATLRDILTKSIRPMYAAKGYVAVTFPKIDTEKSPENQGYVVHVQIQEGPVFRFGNSAFRGGSFTADDVRSMMHYKKGETFDGSKAEQLRHDLVESMRHKGSLEAKVELSQQEDDKNLSINLTYTIVPGPLFTFQTLEIHGLDIESEPEIRKLWGAKPGKPFNPDYPDFFLKRVREMGLFDNLGTTRSTFTPDETTHEVVVKLFFGGAEGEAKKAKQKGVPVPEPPAQQTPP
jgi:outer membrane protein assembly factor BamA